MLQSYGLQQDVVVSRHLRSDLYLGHIFLSDIPAPSTIHRNLRRSKVVENIAMVDYTPYLRNWNYSMPFENQMGDVATGRRRKI
jgi:hypothetical protein